MADAMKSFVAVQDIVNFKMRLQKKTTRAKRCDQQVARNLP